MRFGRASIGVKCCLSIGTSTDAATICRLMEIEHLQRRYLRQGEKKVSHRKERMSWPFDEPLNFWTETR
jgi:hypothetical protein